MAIERLIKNLDDNEVVYYVVNHQQDYTAMETARDTGTSAGEFAKAVVLEADGRHVMVVMPASDKVDLAKACEALGATDVHLVDESTLGKLFPDCELGAEPPFGNLYGLPVYVSPTLTEDEYITFNAGTHTQAIQIPYRDYARLVSPRVIDIKLHS